MNCEPVAVPEAAAARLPHGFVAASPEAAVAAQICAELGCSAETVMRAFGAPGDALHPAGAAGRVLLTGE